VRRTDALSTNTTASQISTVRAAACSRLCVVTRSVLLTDIGVPVAPRVHSWPLMRDATLPLAKNGPWCVRIAGGLRDVRGLLGGRAARPWRMGGVYLAVHRVPRRAGRPQGARSTICQPRRSGRRLFGEHTIASRVRHPGVVDFASPRNADDVPFLVMEFLDGGDARCDLGSARSRCRRSSDRGEVASATKALHERGVVHRSQAR
jgi:hypothetical protein